MMAFQPRPGCLAKAVSDSFAASGHRIKRSFDQMADTGFAVGRVRIDQLRGIVMKALDDDPHESTIQEILSLRRFHMRLVPSLILIVGLSGCGYNTWWNAPLTGGRNPNQPVEESENMHRVLGDTFAAQTITTEPGDIWPGPLPPAPTLKDLETTGGLTPQTQAPVPGSPLSRGVEGPAPSPNPSSGSSTPPVSNQPGLATPRPAPPLSSYASPPAAPPGRVPGGQVIQTPEGSTVTTGGTQNYQTGTSPGGGQSIIVPNGNGTSTVIHSDGRIETVPTPK
jgi:hypothetical protein